MIQRIVEEGLRAVERMGVRQVEDGGVIVRNGERMVKIGDVWMNKNEGWYVGVMGPVKIDNIDARKEVVEDEKLPLGEWIRRYPKSTENAWMGDLEPHWGKVIDQKEASMVLAKVRRTTGKYVEESPLGHCVGEMGKHKGNGYRYLGAIQGTDLIRIARINPQNGRYEWLDVRKHDFRSDYLSSNHDPRDVVQGSERNRYTVLTQNQLAREFDKMGRPFYVAGDRIEGSVIQHGDEEILVVDFEKDKDMVLLKFYEDVMSEYQSSFRKESLPNFIQKKILERVSYDLAIDNMLLDGNLDTSYRMGVAGKLNNFGDRLNYGEIAAYAARVGPLRNKKTYLGNYLNMGFGVCRHQAAILGACMERAIESGRAPGWKGVELRANFVTGKEGHMWVVCQDESGREIICDPARNYYGMDEQRGWKYDMGYENHEFGVPNS